MKAVFEYEFRIGQKVFYNVPEGDQGIVTDIAYSIRTGQVMYEVAFGLSDSNKAWCYSEELSDERIIV